jgi:hypothetical protein
LNSCRKLLQLAAKGAARSTGSPDAVDPPNLLQLTNFESSPLRWAYDVLLAEYNALRQEFLVLRQSIENTYQYMFVAVGAILASQLISNPAIKTLNQHPTVYLGGALVSLWFPLNNLVISVDLTSAGAYVREVLAPKINHLVEYLTTEAARENGIERDRLIGWNSSMSHLVTNGAPDGLRAPMSWEEFNPSLRYATRARRSILIPMYTLRSALLYAPSGILVARFVALSPTLSLLDIILLGLLGCVAVISTAALFSLSNLVSYGQRHGAFRKNVHN